MRNPFKRSFSKRARRAVCNGVKNNPDLVGHVVATVGLVVTAAVVNWIGSKQDKVKVSVGPTLLQRWGLRVSYRDGHDQVVASMGLGN